MRVQQASYLSLLSSLSLTSASLLDFSYDFCDSSSLLASFNPLCERPGTSLVELPLLSRPQDVLEVGHDHEHDHPQHTHDHIHTHEPQSPWSKVPQCIQHTNSTSKHCVYTDTTFATNRGISFFARSNLGPHLHSLEAFTPTADYSGVNHATDPRYVSKPIPGKGLGLVALRPIHRGEVLFRSTPVLVLEEDEFNETQRIPYYNLAAKQLPKASKKMVDDLMGHFGGDPVEDKINTNCFAVELEVGGESVVATAVFPEMSRMNHDCRPNSHYYFDPHTLIQHVHALRTILPGEEITISYIDPAQTSEIRKAALHTSWGFPCGCNACNAPKPIRDASDARIEEIHRITGLLNDYSRSGKIKDSERQGIHAAELLVEFYRIEGMLGPVSEGYAFAALEFSSAMRKWEALKYAHLALESGLLYGGPKDADVMGMSDLIRKPEAHWSWGVRARNRWQELQGQQQV